MDIWHLFSLFGLASVIISICTVDGQSQLQLINVALKGSATTKYSCGHFGDEVYYNHTEALWSAADRQPKTCTADLFPAQYMIDGSLDTFWQSASRSRLYADAALGDDELDTIIEIDLHQIFIAQQLSLSLGDSKRPNHMSLSTSVDGLTWSTIAYKVTIETECLGKFGVMLSSQPLDDNGYICTSYGRPISNGDEVITFDLSQYALLTWKTARFLRFSFYQMHLTLGISGDKFQHYTVRELQVLAVCPCNGLATDCTWNDVSNEYECVCGYNSQGKYCESCLPLYHNQPYQRGVACQGCECYGHAQTCEYDEKVANISTMSSQGDVYGGGVCINCSDFTTGVRCESCIDYYYRPLNVSQNDSTPCLPCNCLLDGVVLSPSTGLLGDCMVSADSSLSMVPGDCYCKLNVGRAKCDQCLPSFYNLSADNALGCQDCQCTVAGTVDNTNICDHRDGRCTCKTFVQGFYCDQCRDGFFGLSLFNPQGCNACSCTPGASISSTCNKTTGQCYCKPFTTGRTCHRIIDGYYYLDMDSISVEPEVFSQTFDVSLDSLGVGYIVANESWVVELSFPVGGDGDAVAGVFDVYIRYSTDRYISTTATVAVLSQVEQAVVVHPPCPQVWCYSKLLNQPITAQTGDVTFINLLVNGSLLLDSLILMPHEFYTGAVDNVTVDVPQQCQLYHRSVEEPISAECEEYIYSMSMLYYDQALPCNCNSTGSISSVCSPRGGSCSCKPGVGGRTCDQCIAGFYNLTSQGCEACRCAGEDKLCNDLSGECNCSPSLEGHMCDRCIADYWKWTPTECEWCGCDADGSKDSQCNSITGQCTCMPGVDGSQCDSCMSEFYNLTTSGCTPCPCHVTGSVDNSCHNMSGQCPCKENVMGKSCDVCTPQSYYFGGDERSGCISCHCMGVSNECDSYSQPISEMLFDLRLATVTAFNFTNSVGEITVQSNNSITVDSSLLYLRVVPPGGDNLLLYYTSSIEVTYTPSPVLVTDTVLTIYLRSYSNELILSQINITAGVYSYLPLRAALVETSWRDSTGLPLSRESLLDFLAVVEGIYLPLNLGTGSIQLSNLQLTPSELSPQLVEQCECGVEYLGLSCETCAFGYTRQAIDNTNACTECNCNGLSADCSVTTGECRDCMNYTAGVHCELCQAGYYGGIRHGDADGCRLCPCNYYGSESPLCDIVNGTVTCMACRQGYIGDLCDQCEDSHWFNETHCLPCECSGNSDVCDYTTGECVDCGNNSTGWFCDVCTDGFYGDATTQSCSACGCDIQGSLSSVCHPSTGLCLCTSNVVSRTCSLCEYGYWNFSTEGCTACNCEPSGSLSQQCDLLSGICSCRENATGSHCELCSLGTFGLPLQPCQGCDCNETGSVNYTLPCDVSSGQCECRDGADGRSCDECMDMFYNFSSSGCTECGECETRLSTHTDRYLTLVQDYMSSSDHLLSLTYHHNELIDLYGSVSQLSADSDIVNGIYNRTWNLLSGTKDLVNSLLTNYTKLESYISTQLTAAYNLENSTLSSYNILLMTHQRSVDISMQVQTLQNLTGQIIEYKQSLYAAVCEDVVTWQQYWMVDDGQLDVDLAAAADVFSRINDSISLLRYHYSRSTQLEEDSLTVNSRAISLLSLYNKLDTQTEQLNTSLTDLWLDFLNTSHVFNRTEMYYSYNQVTYNTTIASVDRCSVLYTSALSAYNSSLSQLEHISFLQQNLTAQIEDTKKDLGSVTVGLNISLQTLPELQLKVDHFNQAALNVTSLLVNLSRDDSPSTNLYTSYVNTSQYIEHLLNLSLNINTSLSAYEAGLSEESLSQLAVSIENSTYTVRQLKIDSSWTNATAEDLLALTEGYTALSTVWNSEGAAISNTSLALESLKSSLVNNSASYSNVQDSLLIAEDTVSRVTPQLTSLAPTFTSYYNLAEILYNTSLSTAQTARLLNTTAEDMKQTLADITNTTETLTSIEQSHSQRISDIQQRLAALEAALIRTTLWSMDQKKSVRVDGNKTVMYNVTVDREQVFEVSVEFSLSNRSDQLMLTVTSEGLLSDMLLSFTDEALQLSVYYRGEVLKLTSRAYVFSAIWTRAIITCFKSNISLLVTDLEDTRTSILDETSLPLNGSLLSAKVQLHLGQGNIRRDWKPFTGCLQSLRINSVTLNLQSTSVRENCCPSASQVSSHQAISLDGFGFAYINNVPSSVQNLSFSLRTYSTAGDVISLVGANNSTLVSLRLSAGRLELETMMSTTRTSYQYSNGLWVDVRCTANDTSFLCSVTSDGMYELLYAALPSDLRLSDSQILLSTETNDVNRFAGCLANLTVDSHRVDPWLDIGRFRGVRPYCLDQVEAGLILKADSLLSLSHTLPTEEFINITAEFMLREPTGSVLFISSANVTVEVGVVSSRLVIVAKVEELRHYIELSTAILDTQFHILSIKLNASRIQLGLDGDLLVEKSMYSNLLVSAVGNTSWLLQLGRYKTDALPVSRGFTGGIRRLQINNWVVPLQATSIYSTNHMASLSGIPFFESLPAQVITSPPPTCSPPVEPLYSSTGRRFGDNAESYAMFNSLNISRQFNLSSVVVLRFRAVSPDGLLCYMPDNPHSPTQWISLFLRDEYIHYNLQTSTMLSDTMVSRYTYADGSWYSVTLLRYHDFAALVVNGNDYTNNGRAQDDNSYLSIGGEIFVGGLNDETKLNLPSSVEPSSFDGCIDDIRLSSFYSAEVLTLNLTSASMTEGTGPCYRDIKSGYRLLADGFIHLASGIDVKNDTDLEYSVTAGSVDVTYPIMTVADAYSYVTVYTTNSSQVVVALGTLDGSGEQIFYADLRLTDVNLCDVSADVFNLKIANGSVTLAIGDVLHQYSIDEQSNWQLINADVYIGAVPATVTLPSDHISAEEFEVCVDNITLNGELLSSADFISTLNVSIGCL